MYEDYLQKSFRNGYNIILDSNNNNDNYNMCMHVCMHTYRRMHPYTYVRHSVMPSGSLKLAIVGESNKNTTSINLIIVYIAFFPTPKIFILDFLTLLSISYFSLFFFYLNVLYFSFFSFFFPSILRFVYKTLFYTSRMGKR